MLPTTYRGAAIIDGERLPAVLHLGSDSVRLALDTNQEVLRWPIGSLEVESNARGEYELKHGQETFTFEPSIDDGLGDEISLRRRFSDDPVDYAKPDPPASHPPDEVHSPGPPPPSTIAQRAAAAGRHVDTGRSFLPRFPDFRRYLLGGSLVLIVLTAVAILVTLITSDTPGAEAAQEQSPTSAPIATSAPVVSTAAPDPEPPPTTVPATTPPTVAGATVTTVPPDPDPTAVPAGSVFELSASELAQRWDSAVRTYDSGLVAGELQEAEGEFAFEAGPFVRLQGSTTDGVVSRMAFLGDPSGTVEDDQEVLTGLGTVLRLVEPSLPPEGRRELLAALGFDVENPEVDGLDNTLDYREHRYWLRWDADLERLVLDVRPSGD